MMMKSIVGTIAATFLAGTIAAPGWAQPSPGNTPVSAAERQIQSALRNDPDLKNNKIEVRVQNQVATLTGSVDTAAERTKAEQLARVNGIVAVDNQLAVAATVAAKQADIDSATNSSVKTQLMKDETLRQTDITIATTKGIVKLTGTVPTEADRQRAATIAGKSTGVRGVDNQLSVVSPMLHPPLPTGPGQ